MSTVAVVAHARKSFDGGLRGLREVLAREGVTDPLWCEVKKSRHAPECARRAEGADRAMKDRLGRVAYLYTAARGLLARRLTATVEVDGRRFFEGRVSLVLAANVGTILGAVEVFAAAKPDDGLLEFGVVTARNPVHWARILGRVALGSAERSPFVEMTRGRSFRVRFDRRLRYQVDGGVRAAAKDLRIDVHPRSVTVCVPA